MVHTLMPFQLVSPLKSVVQQFIDPSNGRKEIFGLKIAAIYLFQKEL
jgi:hypothetical protein